MHLCRPQTRLPRAGRLAILALAAATLSSLFACAWDPWIPGERNWNPDIVVKPGDLSDQLPLDSRFVDELRCYTRLCERRFRIVVERPGTLAVSLIPELASDDDQARLVLEGILGVLDRASTGRGPRTDVPALAVRAPVDAGIYFVLLQSVGGPMPFQLMARLVPGEGVPPAPTPTPVAQPALPEGPPLQLVDVGGQGNVRAGYDPAVPIERLLTFRFPAPVAEDDPGLVGAPLEQPIDRQIRRNLAEALTSRGFRQAAGDESADLIVDFSRGTTNRAFSAIFSIYELYGYGTQTDWAFGDRVETTATLVIDIVDAHSDRIAWHARTTRGLGPGITPGAATDALIRASVTESLAGFPPR